MSTTITVRVPVTIRKRGGRRLVVAPDGAPWSLPKARIDNTLVKALARAFRWRRMLEDGSYSTIKELAAAEKINASYLCRVLRLTLLAPAIVEAILDGWQPEGMALPVLMEGVAVEWERPYTPA
jgi:hypothetical protein